MRAAASTSMNRDAADAHRAGAGHEYLEGQHRQRHQRGNENRHQTVALRTSRGSARRVRWRCICASSFSPPRRTTSKKIALPINDPSIVRPAHSMAVGGPRRRQEQQHEVGACRGRRAGVFERRPGAADPADPRRSKRRARWCIAAFSWSAFQHLKQRGLVDHFDSQLLAPWSASIPHLPRPARNSSCGSPSRPLSLPPLRSAALASSRDSDGSVPVITKVSPASAPPAALGSLIGERQSLFAAAAPPDRDCAVRERSRGCSARPWAPLLRPSAVRLRSAAKMTSRSPKASARNCAVRSPTKGIPSPFSIRGRGCCREASICYQQFFGGFFAHPLQLHQLLQLQAVQIGDVATRP